MYAIRSYYAPLSVAIDGVASNKLTLANKLDNDPQKYSPVFIPEYNMSY